MTPLDWILADIATLWLMAVGLLVWMAFNQPTKGEE